MKKVISLALCLIMCFVTFSATALTALAAPSATDFFDVTSTGVQNSKVTYVINIKPGVKRLNGAIFNVVFDPTVLSVESAEAISVPDEEGNKVPVVSGEYIDGFEKGSNSVFSIAYMSNIGYTTSSEFVGMYKITFKIITNERPSTTVKFYCKESSTNDDFNNDIKPIDGKKLIKDFVFSTLDNPTPISAELLDDGILFTWGAVPGVEKYTVLRKADNVGVWETVAVLTEADLTYKDTNVESGVTYTYSATCGNGYGDSGFLSTGVKALYLAPPAISAITNLGNIVRVSWSSVGGAESYAVYRKTAGEAEWNCLGKVASTRLYYMDEAVTSGTKYEYAISAENGEVSTSVGVNSVSHEFLGAPTITSIKNTNEGIALSWNAIDNADYYLLYRKAQKDSEWSLLSTETATSFVDATAEEGVIYNYSLKTVKGESISSFDTAGVSIARILKPNVTWLEVVADGVNVYWEKSDFVTGYSVYRKARGEDEWQKIADLSAVATSYKDTEIDGGYYFYGVVATIDRYESVMGSVDYDAYFLRSPKNLNVKNDIKGLKVSWEPSKNANYYIIRKTVNDSTNILAIAEVTNTMYIDEDVNHLSTYSYSVTAVDKNGISSVGNPFTTNIYRIAPPTVTGVYADTTSVNINWTKIAEADSYNIYRREENGTWLKVASVSDTESSYSDSKVTSGVKYYYTVTAVINSTESYIGDDNAKSIVYVNIPKSISATLTSNGIKLSWGTGDGLSNFNIYKRVKGENDWILLTTTNSSITALLDTEVLSGMTYEYALRAISNDGNFESEMSEVREVTYLSMVPSIKLANAAGYIKVSWGKVSGAAQYVVYRKLSGGSWEVLKQVSGSTTSFSDKTAESGKTYYYTVRAYTNGFKSAYSEYKIFSLAAPKITKFDSQIGKGITIKWADVHGAEKYYVYRKTGNSSWEKIGTTDNLLFVDKNVKLGTKYTYTVRANGSGVTSSYYSSGWSKTFTPGTPAASSISASSNAITLKWGKVSGASGYRVYRKAQGQTSWSQIAKITGTSYTDKKVSKNVKYTYTIRAYKGNVLSEYNKTGWASAIMSVPTVKIANDASGVKVSWSKNKCADGYAVYRSQYNTATKKWSSWKGMGTAKSSATSWVDKSASSGVTYKYTVRTVCGNTKSAYKQSSSLLYLAQPKVTISNDTSGITVKWNKITSSKGYKVYRSQYNPATSSWSSWKNMGTANSSKTSWTDRSVVSGEIYKYTVRTVNGKTLSSYKATSGLMYLETPALLSGVKTAEGNVIEFRKVPEATGYIIYRKPIESSSWVRVATTDKTVYVDNNLEEGVEYIYTVRATADGYSSYYQKSGITCK